VGGDTTFDTGPSVCTAKGGAGGVGMGAVAGANIVNGGLGGASASGIGDVKRDGNDGGYGDVPSGGTNPFPGFGAGSVWGGSVRTDSVAQNPGRAGGKYGGGASGGISTTTSQAGAVGGAGAIQVTEYF
jgi:hypothetical protein